MRVTGGTLKGRKLLSPSTRAIRPMRDAVRAALFNVLAERVAGSRFLDLFAGTGSVGIEALSRGAAHCVFVDRLPSAIAVLRANLHRLSLEDRAQVWAQDAFAALQGLDRQGESFDLVFIGPPYGQRLAHRALAALVQTRLLAPEGLAFAEVFKKETLQDTYGPLRRIRRRVYGDNAIHFYSIGVSEPELELSKNLETAISRTRTEPLKSHLQAHARLEGHPLEIGDQPHLT